MARAALTIGRPHLVPMARTVPQRIIRVPWPGSLDASATKRIPLPARCLYGTTSYRAFASGEAKLRQECANHQGD